MQFYSYLWLREDGSPYYAGKGSGDRAFVRKNHVSTPPINRESVLIFPMESESDALESERALIELFGRRDLGTGVLENRTSGGQGTSGRKYSEETKRKIAVASSRTQRGRKHSPEHVAKVAEANKGKHKNIQHLIEWHKTHPVTPEWRANLRAANVRRAACQ